jgi:nucleotide-binding universal stress UspA family protein
MLPIKRILHPTDFSELSRSAFEFACALARDYNAALIVLHVYPQTSVFAPDGIAVPIPVEEPYEMRVQLGRIVPTDPRVPVEHHLAEGNPVDQILHYAKTEHADLIVMGTHGATGITRLLMGSVAEGITRKATCPVLTVRGPFHAYPVEELAAAQPVGAG